MSPIITAWLTYLFVLILFSIGCGAMFLPPAVTMMSFLRSVIARKPSRSSPMSPVWNQPLGVDRFGGRRGLVEVALHDVRSAREDLAVRRRSSISTPATALPTVPMRKFAGVFTAITGDVSVRP